MRKGASTINLYRGGAGTLEMLVATSVLLMSITGVIIVVFGNQSLAVDIQTNQEALKKAEYLLEEVVAASQENFSSVSSETETDDIYTKELRVTDSTSCRKEVVARVSWTTDTRALAVELVSTMTDIAGTLLVGGDCDASPPTGDWSSPQTLGHIDAGPGNEATGIDVFNKIVYLTAEASDPAKDDFFTIDAADGASPVILASLNTGPGLNAVDTARDPVTGARYAYVANNDTSSQLQIIDVTDPSSPVLVSSSDLAGASGTNSEGRSIFYYDQKVFVGSNYLPSLGMPRPEFHIFDVSDPASPAQLGQLDVNHNISAIIVRGDYAYLATSDNNGEVWVVDVSNPAAPAGMSTFDAVGSEDGTSIYLVGNTLYLGRRHGASGRPDFYILNVQNPAAITVRGAINLGMSPSIARVFGIRVSGRFAFLATGDSNEEFQVYDISNPASIVHISTFDFPQAATAIDYEDNLIYSAVRSNDALRIIYSP